MVALSDVQAALGVKIEPKITRIANRHALLATLLTKQKGSGAVASWDVEIPGATAETYADGADVSTYDADTTVNATLAWGKYRTNLLLTGLALAAAGTSPSPDELVDLFMAKSEGKISKLLSKLNADLYTAAAGGNTVVGLQTALAATGSYAGLDQGTYATWAGNVLANGGTARPLTKALLDAAEKAVFVAKGESPQVLILSPGGALKYEGLFDSATKNSNAPDLSPLAGILQGSLETAKIPPVIVRNLVGYYKGMPVFRDLDCPSGQGFMLNLEEIFLELLPPATSAAEAAQTMAMKGNQRDPSPGFNVTVEKIGKSGDASKWMMKLYPILKVKARNAHAWIKDIDET